jgi:hypothetical protein
MSPNYENGKIYKIVSPNTKLVYYGSTVKELSARFSGHKTVKSNCTSKHIIAFGGAVIELIKNFPCSCVEDLEDMEACYILDDWAGCVNESIPGAIRRAGGRKAYDKENAVKIAEQQKQYRKENAVKIAEQQKQYQKENAVKIAEYRKQKIECEKCGSFISRRNMAAHTKTSKKCLKAFETQQCAKTIINIQHVEHLTVNK